MPLDENYLKMLRERASKSRIYSRHQMVGVQLAEILGDSAHKGLYIKLAKQHDVDKLLNLAKRIAGMKLVKNKGGYFMKVLFAKE
jgi:hypothetical protein